MKCRCCWMPALFRVTLTDPVLLLCSAKAGDTVDLCHLCVKDLNSLDYNNRRWIVGLPEPYSP